MSFINLLQCHLTLEDKWLLQRWVDSVLMNRPFMMLEIICLSKSDFATEDRVSFACVSLPLRKTHEESIENAVKRSHRHLSVRRMSSLSERKMRNKTVMNRTEAGIHKQKRGRCRKVHHLAQPVRGVPGSTRPEPGPAVTEVASFASLCLLKGLRRALGLGYLYSLERR